MLGQSRVNNLLNSLNFSSDYCHYDRGAVCTADSAGQIQLFWHGRSDVRLPVVELWTKPSGLTGTLLVRIICNCRIIQELNFLLLMASVLDAVVVESKVLEMEVVLSLYVSNNRVEEARARDLSISKLVNSNFDNIHKLGTGKKSTPTVI